MNQLLDKIKAHITVMENAIEREAHGEAIELLEDAHKAWSEFVGWLHQKHAVKMEMQSEGDAEDAAQRAAAGQAEQVATDTVAKVSPPLTSGDASQPAASPASSAQESGSETTGDPETSAPSNPGSEQMDQSAGSTSSAQGAEGSQGLTSDPAAGSGTETKTDPL